MRLPRLTWRRRAAAADAMPPTPSHAIGATGLKPIAPEQLYRVAGGGVDPFPMLRIARANMMVSPEL